MSEAAQGIEPVHLPQPVVLVRRLGLRWMIAAVLLGAVSALAAALVRLGFSHLQWVFTGSTAAPPIAADRLGPWRRAWTPAAGALLATGVAALRRWRAHRLGREPRAYVDYVQAVRHGDGAIPLLPNCWRTLGAAFSIASGAAVGREGSMIQFAAAIASVCGDTLRRRFTGTDSLDPRLLVSFGVVGGVTAAYNAPLAAIFFAAEIVLGGIEWRELPLLALAAGSGHLVSGPLLGWGRLYATQVSLRSQGWVLAWLPVVAALFALAGPLYQRLIRSLTATKRWPLALVWAGILVGLLSLRDPRVWGNGDLGLSAALGRAELPGWSIAAPALASLLGMRLLASSVSVGAGTVGGVFTPTLFAGGAMGALLGHAAPGADPAFWAIVGMSCLMAAVTHAPLMAAFMAVELTGAWTSLPLLLVLNLISWKLAQSLSSEALYAIASQSPASPGHGGVPDGSDPARKKSGRD